MPRAPGEAGGEAFFNLFLQTCTVRVPSQRTAPRDGVRLRRTGRQAGVHADGTEPSPRRLCSLTQLTRKPCSRGHVPTARSRGWGWPRDGEGLAQGRAEGLPRRRALQHGAAGRRGEP